MKERVLCLGNPCKFLNVINNQYVNGLVEIDEVIGRIVAYRIGVLYLEQVSRYVQNSLFGIKFLNLCTDGVGQVRFTYSRCSVEEQRIEDGLCRIERNGFSHTAREFVAFPFNKCIKVVVPVQMGVEFCYLGSLGNVFGHHFPLGGKGG